MPTCRITDWFHCCLFLLAASPCTTMAQNLLVNGDFESDLSHWDFPDATPTWTMFDVNGSPSSGSAYFENTQAAAGTRQIVLRQCVQVVETGAYVFGVSGYTPLAQDSNGNLLGDYYVDLHHADCSGGFSAVGGFYLPSLGTWQTYATTTQSNPAMLVQSLNPDASIMVELIVEKLPAGGSFGGYFDAVYVLRDTLFTDGFETQ